MLHRRNGKPSTPEGLSLYRYHSTDQQLVHVTRADPEKNKARGATHNLLLCDNLDRALHLSMAKD